MEQSQTFFDVTTQVTLAASLLVSAAAYVVMRVYLRKIFRESQRPSPVTDPTLVGRGGSTKQDPPYGAEVASHAPEIVVERPEQTARPRRARSQTFRHAGASFHRAAFIYLLGGSIHAATSVALLSTLSPPPFESWSTLLACYAGRFWAWSFFTMITLALFYGPDRRVRRFLVAAYILALPVLGIVLQLAGAPSLSFTELAEAEPALKEEAGLLLPMTSAVLGTPVSPDSILISPSSQPVYFWALTGAPLMIPLLTFNRFVRGTVGPLFTMTALIVLVTILVINDLWLDTPWGVALATQLKQVAGNSTFAVIMAISGALSLVMAVSGLRWMAGRYRRRQLSDQMFLFDALWLAASLWVTVYLMGDRRPFYYLLGLVPFALYWITVRYGLRPMKTTSDTLPEASLLYLRVFGSARRAEKLFEVLAARWRHAGSIQLVSATDVARGRFEPDEFLDFVSGKLAGTYISSDRDLAQRLAVLPRQCDPDGRYRVNEFFCRTDTWQGTVSRLAAESSLVVMDLRAFTARNQGCIFELSVLVDEVPFHHVALLIDRTTDEPLLRKTLTKLWERMHPRSPNAGHPAQIRFVDLAQDYPAAVRHLVRLGDEVIAAG